MPSTTDYITLLYKKFLGSPNGYPNSNFLGDIPVNARPNITQSQIFSSPIPSTAPTVGTLLSLPSATHPSVESDSAKIWNGTDVISDFGKIYSPNSPDDYLIYFEDLVLVMENEGVSYTCRSRVSSLNLFANQVPYNSSTSLTEGSYNPVIKIWTKNGSSFTSEISVNNAPGRQWILDQDAGVLTFYGTPINTSTQYVTASFWKYVGDFGVTGSGPSGVPVLIDGGDSTSSF